jgi:hypothetical protein
MPRLCEDEAAVAWDELRRGTAMPITWHENHRTGWIEIAFSDPYTLEDAERVMKEVYSRLGLSRPLRFLVDVTTSTPPSSEFVVNATTFWQMHAADMWGARIAIVTATAPQQTKAELTEHSTMSRELPFTVRVFADSAFDAAKGWLSQRT